MRVAICVVLGSMFFAAVAADAAVAVEAAAAYPAPAVARNAAASGDAIAPSAAPQQRAAAATGFKSANRDLTVRADELEFDRRLASLDPSHIVYEQSQSQPPLAQAGLLDLSNGRLFPRQEQREPARRPLARSAEDFMLMGFAALMLVVYQLRKKHRVLRPQPFSY